MPPPNLGDVVLNVKLRQQRRNFGAMDVRRYCGPGKLMHRSFSRPAPSGHHHRLLGCESIRSKRRCGSVPPAPQDDCHNNHPADLVQDQQPDPGLAQQREHQRPTCNTAVASCMSDTALLTAAAAIARLNKAMANETVRMPAKVRDAYG